MTLLFNCMAVFRTAAVTARALLLLLLLLAPQWILLLRLHLLLPRAARRLQ